MRFRSFTLFRANKFMDKTTRGRILTKKHLRVLSLCRRGHSGPRHIFIYCVISIKGERSFRTIMACFVFFCSSLTFPAIYLRRIFISDITRILGWFVVIYRTKSRWLGVPSEEVLVLDYIWDLGFVPRSETSTYWITELEDIKLAIVNKI